MNPTVSFSQAVFHLAVAAGLWVGAMVLFWRAAPRRSMAGRDTGVALLAFTLAAWWVGQGLWHTTDSVNDLERAKICAETLSCPALGVLASYGGYEGGVAWNWVLALFWSLSDDPAVWSALVAVIHGTGAAALVGLAPTQRSGILAGTVCWVTTFVMAPAFILWHPTLAPIAALPFVLWSAKPTNLKPQWLAYALIGASFSVALGIYIACLFLFPLGLAPLLRGRFRDFAAMVAGFGTAQALVTPTAAWHNLQQIDVEALGLALVGLVVAWGFRKRWLNWAERRGGLLGTVAVISLLVLAVIVADHFPYPYYFALVGPLLGLWVMEIPAAKRRKTEWGALAALATLLVASSLALYVFLAGNYHEGRYYLDDMHDLSGSYRGGYGVSATAPSNLLDYSMGLWGRPGPPEGTGGGFYLPEESPTAVCDEIQWSRSGRLGFCEYQAWTRTRGARLCDIGAPHGGRCKTYDSPQQLSMSLGKSPIEYDKDREYALEVEVTVNVCPAGEQPRLLSPWIYAGLPFRRRAKIQNRPFNGIVSEDGSGILIAPTGAEGRCEPLTFRWDATKERLAGFVEETIKHDVYDRVVFGVEERHEP